MTRPAPTVTDHPSALVSVPVERVQRYLARLKKSHQHDQERIHAFDLGEPSEAELFVSDLEALVQFAAAPAAPQAAGVGEVERPLGAAENGSVLLDRIEHNYIFACEGGELKNCAEWHEARRCFEALADFARHASLRAPSREPEGGAVSRDQVLAIVRQFASPSWCSVDRLVDTLFTALATREEAPALENPDEPSAPENARDWPQAREDARPVAWTEDMERERREADYERGFIHGKASALDDAKSEPVAWRGRDLDAFGDGAWAVCSFKPSCDVVQPLYTHPAPDALRVAVEAFMPSAEVAFLWSKETPPAEEVQRYRERYWAVKEALAALQAEQKGGA